MGANGLRCAAWRSDRTAELGYRISPTVIAKLDSGHRGEVLSVPELLVLAAALGIPPALLIFPRYPSGSVELLPDDREATSYEAVKWLAGERPLPARRPDIKRRIAPEPANLGVQLVAPVRERDERDRERVQVSAMAARRKELKEVVADLEADGATIRARIADLHEQLWGADAGGTEGSGDG
jgi:hypothetical protein